MTRATDAARRLYRPQLADGETVHSVHRATAAGTGTRIALGSIAGALIGWLYAIFLDASLLVPLVFGALAGLAVGYLQSERAARRPEGPGTVHLGVVLTSANLITLRQYGVRRNKALRRYPLDQITGVSTKRYPIADYHLQEITMADGTITALIVEDAIDLDHVNRGSTSG